MAFEDTLRTIVGVIGNIISIFLFLSPCPTFYKIFKWRSTRRFSGIPYLAAFTNCILWVFYGLPFIHPHSILVVTVNGAGCVLEVIYLAIFFIFCKKTRDRIKLLATLLSIVIIYALIVVLVLILVHNREKRSFIVGIFCTVFNVCMYASPLSIMRRVIRTKSVKYLPIHLCVAGFLNGICWTIYGCIRFDIFIVIPNGLGALLASTQLLLYAIYYKSTKWDAADSEEEDETVDPTGREMNMVNINK